MSFFDDLRKRATGILETDYSGLSSDAQPPIVNQRGVAVGSGSNFQTIQPQSLRSPIMNNQTKPNAPDAVLEGQKKFGLGEKQFQRIFGIDYGTAQS